MEDILSGLGFSTKETAVYQYLIENGPQSAAHIAKACGEKRSNTYVLLENLLQKKVIVASDIEPIRMFSAAHPSSLQKLVQSEQDRQAQLAASLAAYMPKLVSHYMLAADKPGVVHMQGSDGFMTLLEDMTRSSTEVQLIASNYLPADAAVRTDFVKLLMKRKAAGIHTRAIFHRDDNYQMRQRQFAERGMELRFLGQTEFTGEVVLYEDNVAFTVYEPSLVVTVITNPAIAATMRLMFEQLWEKAEAK